MSAGKVLFEQGLAIGSSYSDLNAIAFAQDSEPQIVSPEVAAITDLRAARDKAADSQRAAGRRNKELAKKYSDRSLETLTDIANDTNEVETLVGQVNILTEIFEDAKVAEQKARQEKYEASDALAAKISEKKALFTYITDSVKECDTEDVPNISDVEAINTVLNRLGEQMLKVTAEDEEGRSELKASFVTIQKAQKIFDTKSDAHQRSTEHLARAKADLQNLLEKVGRKRLELEKKSKDATKETRQLDKALGRHAVREQSVGTARARNIGRFSLKRSPNIALEAK